jgi:hypothetical protein
MTYVAKGRQFVVVACGVGDGGQPDRLVAFAVE